MVNTAVQVAESDLQEAWRALTREAFVSHRMPLESNLAQLRIAYRAARQAYIDAGGTKKPARLRPEEEKV